MGPSIPARASEDADSTAHAISIAETAAAARLAEATIATWHGIGKALARIIGERGVAALFTRSVHLAVGSHPWLAGAEDGVESTLNLTAFGSLLSQQSASDITAGNGALLRTFREVLASLIGSAMAERLLCSVPSSSFSGQPPRSNSS